MIDDYAYGDPGAPSGYDFSQPQENIATPVSTPIYGGAFGGIFTPQVSNDGLKHGLIHGKADDTLAEVNRRTWEDYQERGIPLENELIATYRDPARWQAQLDNSTNQVNQAYDGVQGTLARDASRAGISLTPQQQEAQRRKIANQRALSIVGARNKTRAGLEERDNTIMTGGVTQGGNSRKEGL